MKCTNKKCIKWDYLGIPGYYFVKPEFSEIINRLSTSYSYLPLPILICFLSLYNNISLNF